MAVIRKKGAQRSVRRIRTRVTKVKPVRTAKKKLSGEDRAAGTESLLAAESVFRMYDEAEARAKGGTGRSLANGFGAGGEAPARFDFGLPGF